VVKRALKKVDKQLMGLKDNLGM